MAEKKVFDLGDVLKNVLTPDTAQEQIVQVDLDKIDADEQNFYSTEGIEELAANIELVGLLDPMRIRPKPEEPGRWLLVSGHRRRLALLMLRDDDAEKWGKASCIIEKPADSPEMQELRLIFANAATRKMTSADLSQQAERVEMLLYKLKKQGLVEFSGRMRDAVAAACKVSAAKIATLKAIKNNMVPELYAFYEKGEINETCAYELQKLPAEGQKAIAESCKRTGAGFIKSWGCELCVQYGEKYMEPKKCENGDECDHHEARFIETLRSKYSWHYCDGRCCLECHELRDCSHPCKKAKIQTAEKKAEEKVQKQEREKEAALLQKKEFQRKCNERKKEARRVLPLIEAAGLGDDDELQGNYYYSKVKTETIRKAAAGDFGDRTHFYGDDHYLIPRNVEGLKSWADKLGCSMDYLAGRTDDPAPSAKPKEWISVDDRYPAEGDFVIAATRAGVAVPAVYFRAAFQDFTEKSVANNRIQGVERWMPLPPLPTGQKWIGQETIEGMVRK